MTPEIHFIEDYKELTGETTAAATKRFKADTEEKVVTAADSSGDAKTTDKAETKA